jgi:alpha-tubulin suppressor-like RCC1 family protein
MGTGQSFSKENLPVPPMSFLSNPACSQFIMLRLYTAAIKTDGSLWAWGYNGYGQLGDGTEDSKLSSVRIGKAVDWRAVAARGHHTIALKKNGSLWAWGWNTINGIKYRPAQIGKAVDWQAVAAGYDHAVALKKDGSLWAWGNNYHGQLGDGTAWKESPVQIIGPDGSYTVTPKAGRHGSISPSTPQKAPKGSTVSFTVTPDAGYGIRIVSSCGGSLNGKVYTTKPVTRSCVVSALFPKDRKWLEVISK